MAAPRISASAVETAAPTDVISTIFRIHGRMCSVADSERHFPVTIPRCAALCCSTISMNVDNVTIQSSL